MEKEGDGLVGRVIAIKLDRRVFGRYPDLNININGAVPELLVIEVQETFVVDG